MPGLANQPVVIHWVLGREKEQERKKKKAVHSLTPISTDCHSLSASGGVIFLKFLLALNMQLLLYLGTMYTGGKSLLGPSLRCSSCFWVGLHLGSQQ